MPEQTSDIAPKTGHDVIQSYLKTLDASPGVYRMLDAQARVLYVGKARNLRARVSNYARPSGHTARIDRMIRETASMMFLTTSTETEALLLEQNLIKQLKPRYNVLLRDDKSFPNILVTGHEFPMIKKHRGAKKEKGHYYGPFASAGAVNRTLSHLHRHAIRKPHPTLPAIPDQALHRALCRLYRQGRLCGGGKGCRTLPVGPLHRDPDQAEGRDGRSCRGDGI